MRVSLALHIYAQLSFLFKIAGAMRQDVPFNIIRSKTKFHLRTVCEICKKIWKYCLKPSLFCIFC